MSVVEIVNLGADVTKFRTRLKKNYPYLSDEKSIGELIEINRKNDPGDYDESDWLAPYFDLAKSTLLTALLLNALEEVYKRPYYINRFALLYLEVYFGLLSDHPLKDSRIEYLLYLCEQRAYDINTNYDIDPIVQFLYYGRIEHPKDAEYPLYFALTLRQTDVLQIPDFLQHQYKCYEGEDYLQFLQLLLIDFEDVFMAKTRVVVEKWIQDQQETYNLLRKTAFLPAPKGWKYIDGYLSPAELKQAFSFLYNVADYAQDKMGYLTQSEVAELLKYGIAFPEGEAKIKQFKLNLNRERSRRLFFSSIYQIRTCHVRETWNSDDKLEWAYFLKKRFTDFADMDIRKIKNELRHRRPKLAPEGFEMNVYLPIAS